MEYKIKFTERCLQDIDSICEYISNRLNAEKAANRLRKKVKNSIKGLSQSPEMFARIDKTDKLKRQYRRIVINNYVLLYTVDKTEKIVYISHMYYAGRNYLEDLI